MMFFWTAINVEDQLCPLRRTAEEASCRIGAENQALSLPFHVSLRISFPVEDAVWEKAAAAVGDYFAALRPFEIAPQAIERNGSVIWLRMAESDILQKIHRDLVDFPQKLFGAPPQPLDDRFIFHCSLFLDDGAKTQAAFALLKDAPFPEKLQARRFIIGASPTGRPGEYRAIQTISIT